jgi:ligand-binding SRPBCC domain-containing protein
MPVFETRIPLPCSQERAFEFLIRPANIKAISPPEVDMVFVEAPEVLQLGSRLVFKVQAYGQPIQFEHEIVSFTRPVGFQERMVNGPLPLWLHEYRLEQDPQTGVVLLNRIEFEPPKGFLGMLITADRMLEQMEAGYAHRREALQKALQT